MADAPAENPWCARVWEAMARDCAKGVDGCARDFRLVCATGWPYEGQCGCGRRWDVHRDKLKKREG